MDKSARYRKKLVCRHLVVFLCFTFVLYLFIHNVCAEKTENVLSETSDIVIDDNGKKTLVIHQPDKYYKNGSWEPFDYKKDSTKFLNLTITKNNDIEIVYDSNVSKKSKDVYVTITPYLVYNNISYTISSLKKDFLKDKNNMPTIEIEDKGEFWKYAFNFTVLNDTILSSNNSFIILNMTYNSLKIKDSDIKIKSNSIIINDKIMLNFDDLLQNNFNVSIFTKQSIKIGNLQEGYLDPTLLISSSTTLCGNVTDYSTIAVLNGGTLRVCDYNGTANTGYVWIQNIDNFTVYPGGSVNASFSGYRGGIADTGEGIGHGHLGGGGHGGGGGGFGGNGGAGESGGTGGIIYGSNTSYSSVGNITNASDMNMGSGGGGSSSFGDDGGDGGGLFIIQTALNGIINIFGTVTSNGDVGRLGSGDIGGGGGGSGGEIVLYGTTINISGITLNAKGGNGAVALYNGGGGGGGKIKIISETLINTSTVLNVTGGLKGGTGAVDGNVGIIYYETLSHTPQTYNKISSDTFTITDEKTRQGNIQRLQNDFLTLTDNSNRTRSVINYVLDNTTINSSLQNNAVYTRINADTLSMLQAILNLYSYNRNLNQTISYNDFYTLWSSLHLNYTVNSEDTFTYNDILKTIFLYNRQNNQTINYNDSIVRVAQINSVVADSISFLSDTISKFYMSNIVLNAPITFYDDIKRYAIFRIIQDGQITYDESMFVKSTFIRNIGTEQIQITDVTKRFVSFVRTPIDSISLIIDYIQCVVGGNCATISGQSTTEETTYRYRSSYRGINTSINICGDGICSVGEVCTEDCGGVVTNITNESKETIIPKELKKLLLDLKNSKKDVDTVDYIAYAVLVACVLYIAYLKYKIRKMGNRQQ